MRNATDVSVKLKKSNKMLGMELKVHQYLKKNFILCTKYGTCDVFISIYTVIIVSCYAALQVQALYCCAARLDALMEPC